MYFSCMSSNTYVITLDLSLSGKLLQGLKDQGFEISTPLYTLFSGKKTGLSCTLYKSGKLMVQGKNKEEFIEFFLEPEILKNFDYKYKDKDKRLVGIVSLGDLASNSTDQHHFICGRALGFICAEPLHAIK